MRQMYGLFMHTTALYAAGQDNVNKLYSAAFYWITSHFGLVGCVQARRETFPSQKEHALTGRDATGHCL